MVGEGGFGVWIDGLVKIIDIPRIIKIAGISGLISII